MVDSKETYKLFAEYYDLYAGNYTEDLEFYKSICKNQDKIIEIGCGTGRVLKSFLDSAFKITGVDISDEMLEISKKKLETYIIRKQLVLLNHDFSNNRFDKQFDKVLITFYTFNYIIQKPAVFLKNVYDSLNEQAVLIMDLFFPQSHNDASIEKKWRTHDFETNNRKITLKDQRSYENNIEHRIQVYTENSGEIRINTERRYYDPNEIKKLLEQVGFKNIQFSLTFQNDKFIKDLSEKDLVKNYIVKAEK
jgi:ubiquinone/menaquinone biosynthesis C-methylase UbiE